MCDIVELNKRFGASGRIRFFAGPGGLVVAELRCERATAKVALHGAHVLEYVPDGTEPVLWLSERSWYEADKPIRGGIPVCWPWFGPHATDADKPSHGFARLRPWQVISAAGDDDSTELVLALQDDGDTRAIWPHEFRLEMRVAMNDSLTAELKAINTGREPFETTAALHSYFTIADVRNVSVVGLEGCQYIDKMDGGVRKAQAGPVEFTGETDRIYVATEADCVIDDPGLGRRIRIAKRGSRSTVVWNPWIAKATRMEDFGDDEWPSMMCVETTNAGVDVITLSPGDSHTLAAIISVE